MTIRQKQWQLYFLGYYGGDLDGIWGIRSQDAAINFQGDNGLEPDGIFGPLTEEKSVEAVKAVQKAVTDGRLAIDGLAGLESRDATARWQAENDLLPDGIAGPDTRRRIEAEAAGEETDWWNGIRYFSRKEFACKCGRYCDGYPAEMERGVVELADKAREALRGAGFVSSGLRCGQHNRNVGGVTDSRHLAGKAVDLRIEGKTAEQTLAWAQKQPQVRYAYAIDANYVHMDIL